MFCSSSSSGRSCAGRRPTRPLSWDADARALSRLPARRPSVGARRTRMERTDADRTGMPCDASVPHSHTRHPRLMSSRRAILACGRSQRPRRESRAGSRPTFHHPVCKGEKPVHMSQWAGFSSRRHRLVATPDRSRSILVWTMTYSKGAPGEVMLDGTVSDPVACPCVLLYRLDEPPFGARSARRATRALAPSRIAVRLSRVVVNGSFVRSRLPTRGVGRSILRKWGWGSPQAADLVRVSS